MGPATVARNLVLIALAVLASAPRGEAWWLAALVTVGLVVAAAAPRRPPVRH